MLLNREIIFIDHVNLKSTIAVVQELRLRLNGGHLEVGSEVGTIASLFSENLQQIVIVPSGSKAFVLDAELYPVAATSLRVKPLEQTPEPELYRAPTRLADLMGDALRRLRSRALLDGSLGRGLAWLVREQIVLLSRHHCFHRVLSCMQSIEAEILSGE